MTFPRGPCATTRKWTDSPRGPEVPEGSATIRRAIWAGWSWQMHAQRRPVRGGAAGVCPAVSAGDSTISKRLDLLKDQRDTLLKQKEQIETALDRLDYKISRYEEAARPANSAGIDQTAMGGRGSGCHPADASPSPSASSYPFVHISSPMRLEISVQNTSRTAGTALQNSLISSRMPFTASRRLAVSSPLRKGIPPPRHRPPAQRS